MKTKLILQAITDSLKGKEHDYTQGSIRLAVLLLAVPMILELSLESVFAVVDIYFVGKLGAYAIATVGLTESVITIIYSLAIGLSTAATAIVARRTGEKNSEAAAHAAAQALMVSVVLTILISIPGFLFAPQILAWMGASEEVVREGASFTRIMLGGSLVIILLFLINGIFRGAGNAAMAMKSLWIASLLNILLCPLFIGWFGLIGAAIATVIGRGSGVLYQLYYLSKDKHLFNLRPAHFTPDWTVIKSIITIAWPATFQFIIASGSWIVLARLVASTGGTDAVAGYQLAIRNLVFFILPAWGLSNATATLVGQNLGAKQPERAAKSAMIIAGYNALFMSFVMLLFVFFPEFIISFYTQDPAVIKPAVIALRIIGSGFIFYGIGMVMTQALNGAGDTRTPTLINLFGFWFTQIPLAFLLSKYLGYGYEGIVYAVPIAETMIALLAWYFFAKGKWKTLQV